MTGKQEYTVLEDIVLGIPLLDKQHADLVRITANLYLLHFEYAEAADFRLIQAIHGITDHFHHHFSVEEKLMSLSGFPEYYEHKKEHEDLLREYIKRSRQILGERNFHLRDFADFLSESIKRHIMFSDRIFADFFLNMKQHSKLGLLFAETSRQ